MSIKAVISEVLKKRHQIREMLFEYHRRRIGERQQKEWIAKGKQAVAASRC